MNMHAIIAGTNKAGTTSLFRYLSAHPEVCPSRIKEMDFFLGAADLRAEELAEQYRAQFDYCGVGEHCSLEASPDYLRHGRQVAERIKSALPDARIIIMIREPVSRIVSYFSSNKQNRFHPKVAELQFHEYVSCMERVKTKTFESLCVGPERNAHIQYQRGHYAKYLDEFLKVFPIGQVHVVFFDDLVADTKSTVVRVAGYLGLALDFYDRYAFTIENRTKQARWPGAQKFAFRMGMRLEPVMNVMPGLRAMGRRLIFRSNGESVRVEVQASDRQRLGMLYEQENKELRRFLSERYPQLHLPAWLR